MAQSPPNPLEPHLRQLWSEQRFDEVATLAIEHYGPTILGLLIKLERDPVAGNEAFSMFCEDLWTGLPGFRWRCSLRTWSFTLARHAAHRRRNETGRRPGRNVPLDRTPLFEIVERVRTRTLAHLRTESKDELRALRASLAPDDQLLLTLRVEQRLPWNEIAPVTLGEADATPERVKREAARLRKRFQLVKGQLRALAEKQGLLPGD